MDAAAAGAAAGGDGGEADDDDGANNIGTATCNIPYEVTEDQTGAPDGPYICVPRALRRVGFGSSVVYVFHRMRPVAASRATTLPRRRQHA